MIHQMQNRRAAGEDGFMAEYLRYGGESAREVVFQVLSESAREVVFQVLIRAWKVAQETRANSEAESWLAEWRVGLVVPLWNRKGDKADKNTWHRVTLLSMGTKAMAMSRLVTNRLVR